MKYYINSVRTYSNSGKSRKGALLQAVAVKFEGFIVDDDALAAMTRTFRALVDSVNRTYKGKPLFLETGNGWLCVKPEYNGNDNHVFSIDYKPVKATCYASNVVQMVDETLFNVARDIDKDYKEGGER